MERTVLSQPLTGEKVIPDSQELAWTDGADGTWPLSSEWGGSQSSSQDISKAPEKTVKLTPTPVPAKIPTGVSKLSTRSTRPIQSDPSQSKNAQFNSLGAASIFPTKKKSAGPGRPCLVLPLIPKNQKPLSSLTPKNQSPLSSLTPKNQGPLSPSLRIHLRDSPKRPLAQSRIGTQPQSSAISMPHQPKLFRVDGVHYDPPPPPPDSTQEESEPEPFRTKDGQYKCPFPSCGMICQKLNGVDGHLTPHIKKRETVPALWLSTFSRTFL